jgi:hypothetical protein
MSLELVDTFDFTPSTKHRSVPSLKIPGLRQITEDKTVSDKTKTSYRSHLANTTAQSQFLHNNQRERLENSSFTHKQACGHLENPPRMMQPLPIKNRAQRSFLQSQGNPSPALFLTSINIELDELTGSFPEAPCILSSSMLKQNSQSFEKYTDQGFHDGNKDDVCDTFDHKRLSVAITSPARGGVHGTGLELKNVAANTTYTDFTCDQRFSVGEVGIQHVAHLTLLDNGKTEQTIAAEVGSSNTCSKTTSLSMATSSTVASQTERVAFCSKLVSTENTLTKTAQVQTAIELSLKTGEIVPRR